MSDAFLRLHDVTLRYGRTIAVEKLNLAVSAGEFVALLGPSGCGKTTTMRAIAGLLKPSAGRIVIDGADVTRVAPNKRDVGLMFQSYALFPHLTVFENVAFGLRLRKLPDADIKTRAIQALASVGLAGTEEKLPKELSGGQQQRVALARAIVVRPRLLLLDEPLSNLDARLRLEMRSEITRLQRELNLPMIYVTHDQVEALALADRIIVMRAGRIEQDGTPEVIYAKPRNEFVARFVGFETILTAARLAAHARLPGPAYAFGWRPRHVVVGTGPYQGHVRGASYLGETVEYLIESEFGPIKAEVAADAPRHGPGQAVAFDLPFARAAPLAADLPA
ncbi:ABC transporter ATP-binding protein [Roseiterribacter gracilis]|uniref:ABC transporter ATP-binding protein n=1 Tax=Roseiterribacter gracilis TaxID=2812848 RepID=A0A8S8X728_9PROT|nr:ABC transporter ATP-binding protein [Rhodospirillales bacterium TMPK1]